MKNTRTYKASVRCGNCGHGGPSTFNRRSREIEIRQGRPIADEPCPDCGCKELRRAAP